MAGCMGVVVFTWFMVMLGFRPVTTVLLAALGLISAVTVNNTTLGVVLHLFLTVALFSIPAGILVVAERILVSPFIVALILCWTVFYVSALTFLWEATI